MSSKQVVKILIGILLIMSLFPLIGGVMSFKSFSSGAIDGLKLLGFLFVLVGIICLAVWLFGGFDEAESKYTFDEDDLKRVYDKGRDDMKESVTIGAYVNTLESLIKQMKKECDARQDQEDSNNTTSTIAIAAVSTSIIH